RRNVQLCLTPVLGPNMRHPGLCTKRTWRGFRRCPARIAVRYQLSLTYYERHILGTFTRHHLLHGAFLDSTRSGTLCAANPLSKNSARKSSSDQHNQNFVRSRCLCNECRDCAFFRVDCIWPESFANTCVQYRRSTTSDRHRLEHSD